MWKWVLLLVAAPVLLIAAIGLLPGTDSPGADAFPAITEAQAQCVTEVLANVGLHPALWLFVQFVLFNFTFDSLNNQVAGEVQPQGFLPVADIGITGPSPVIPVNGQMDAQGQMFASGSGTYSGFQTGVGFSGQIQFNPQGFPISAQGSYIVGGQGLPGGHPIVYGLTCTFIQVTPTPTPPPTPPQDEYSITVLKLNSATHGPLGSWEIELFGNDDCSGTPIDAGVTDDNGLIDFTGLVEGTYSLKEEERTGFTPDGDLCQKAFVGDAVSAASADDLPPCPPPNNPFPAPGCDEFDSGAQVNIDFSPIGGTEPEIVTLNGPTRIHRGPVADGDGDGRDDVQTEIIGMSLTGTTSVGPATVMQSPTRPSNGAFEEQNNAATGTIDFPADSFFDVFVEVDLPQMNMVLHNTQPIRMECIIFQIPPEFCLYQPPVDDPIELYNEQDQLVALIVHAAHIPLPLNEILIVFNNSPALVQGNVDCNVSANSVDSLKILRWVALLSVAQEDGCPLIGAEVASFWGDVDCSGNVNSVDALKILRYVAQLSVAQTEPCSDIGMPIGQ